MADATRLRAFTVDAVPTVFQLAGYADAVSQTCSPTQAAQLARVRETWATRSNTDDPLAIEAVFPEAVLRQVVGGRRVQKAQLLHLLEVGERPEVSIRVLPHSTGAYPAMGTPFHWLSFPHRQHNDVVYTATFLRADYIEAHAEVSQVTDRFTAAQKLALSSSQSLKLLAEAATSV